MAPTPYILGIDLGSASLGWALVHATNDTPRGILAAGVRIFSPGVDGDIDSGQDESRNKKRREARLQRRQFRRRALRAQRLFTVLQTAGLLPAPPADISQNASVARTFVLATLDAQIRQRWLKRPIQAVRSMAAQVATGSSPTVEEVVMQSVSTTQRDLAAEHVVPYILRARALDQRLEPYELGRALYHLGQRRGFKSNRKSVPKADEKPGEVKAGISALEENIQHTGVRTLGEYFASLDPEQQRIRRRWTARKMFEDEFEKIWAAQAAYHPQILTEPLKKRIRYCLFFQRPIKWKRSTIGMCELEPTRRRAPWACLAAQRFRLLQKVNDLKIENDSFQLRALTDVQRTTILHALETNRDRSFSDLRKQLKLSKGERFNLERDGEPKLRGNRTAAIMLKCFGEQWDKLSSEDRDRIVEEWRTIENPETLKRRAMEHWGLDHIHARELSDESAEEGFCSLSRQALAKLLPPMEKGVPFKTAEKEIYGDRFKGLKAEDFLPPVRKALPELRNPAVERALTELRKVVNAIIRKHGKPVQVRIELARELRNPRKRRKELSRQNRDQQRRRDEAAKEILHEAGLGQPSRTDIEKCLLWKECNGECPYTGRRFSLRDLFGETPQFDVEHILPLSRFPDDGFQNKTLCYHEENRNRKRGYTPYEAYGADPQRWGEILDRVRKFNSPHKFRKLQLFLSQDSDTEKLLGGFTERQLNDTRYASKLAQKYLGALYGGRDLELHGSARRIIRASLGQVTATLRKIWRLEGILGSGAESKSRDDHRHHAIDAIVTALTEEKWIRQMSERAAYNTEKYGKPSFGGLDAPWSDFVESIREVINSMHVSHRPEHKLGGQIHDETNYGNPRIVVQNGKPKEVVHIRKPLATITATEILDIVDPVVKSTVQRRLEELGGDLKKLQTSVEYDSNIEPPYLPAENDRKTPIRRVRIFRAGKMESIGHDSSIRHVALANNHHAEIYSLLNEDGSEKRWQADVISLYAALQRRRKREPVIQTNHGPNTVFQFSLMGGDLVEMEDKGSRGLFVVRTITQYSTGQIVLAMVREIEARRINEMKKEDYMRVGIDYLRKCSCHKVAVDLLGNVHELHD